MKLRIKGNSIRLRLTKTDVSNLAAAGIVEEHTNFGSTALSYALKTTAEFPHPQATFVNNRICVSIPHDFAAEWPTNEIVGIDHQLRLTDTDSLFILVEKDFVCLDETSEDQSDNFSNPNQTCVA